MIKVRERHRIRVWFARHGLRWGDLSTRIGVVSALAVVVLTLAVVIVTAISAGAAMQHQIDQQLARMVKVPIPLNIATEPATESVPVDADSHGHDREPGPRHKGEFGVNGPRLPQRQPGALQVTVNDAGQAQSALYSEVSVTALTEQQLATVRTVPVGRPPTTVNLGAIGDYRVIARAEPGQVTYLGLSMRDVNEASRTVAWWATIVGLVAAALAVVVIVVVVRRSTRSLERVARTASDMAKTDLVNGNGLPVERVTFTRGRDATEVVQVATALNALLDQVSGALVQRDRKEAQLRQFVADASHELRTPLAAMKGYAQLGQRDGEPVAALQRIDQQATQMTGLVNDLLALARLDAGHGGQAEVLPVGDCAMAAFTDAVVAFPDHEWVWDESAQTAAAMPARVEIAPLHLRRILDNLLSNAAKHTPMGSEIVLSLRRECAVPAGSIRQSNEGTLAGKTRGNDCECVVISVADNGPGVPAHLRDQVFDRFVSGDAARTQLSSGLGLALARSMAEAVGGSVILAESTVGATFEVWLPVSSHETEFFTADS